MTDCDVLVVGGGPVGVTVGLFCAAQGLSVEVYEKSTDVYPLPRAVVMDDEIQRALAGIGLGDVIRSITTNMVGAEFVNARMERIVGFDTPADGDYPLGFHPSVLYHQPELERTLRAALDDAGVPLREACEVTSVVQSATDVVVDIVGPEGTFTRRARWIVAADGAGSPMRKAASVALLDLGFDQEWVVIDVLMHRDVPLPTHAQQICDPNRVVTFVPGHADWRRWEFQTRPGESGADLATPERLRELLAPWLADGDGSVERAAVYRFHATVAEKMRAGRIFFAGDAAHQMPPFRGQGLCSGVRDAINLSWKLAMVDRGEAGDALLETYDLERRPHATETVHFAIDTGRLIDHLAEFSAAEDPSAGYGGGRGMPSLIDGMLINDHLLVGQQVPNPRLGDGRRLDDHLGNGWAMVVADGHVEAIREVCGHPAIDILELSYVAVDPVWFPRLMTSDTAVLVRPDRMIAAVVHLDDPHAASSQLVELMQRWLTPAVDLTSKTGESR
jgi:3-(3-hydroxy-phenyl)propionate hydroxylase